MHAFSILRCLACLSVLFLTACAGGRFDTPYASGHYESHAMQCVPYARKVSGIQLYGDAYTWWDQVTPHDAQPVQVASMNTAPSFQSVLTDVTATTPFTPSLQTQRNARYGFGTLPQPGAVLVLAQTDRLTHGHLAVVKNVIDPRTINVTQSNWGSNRNDRRIIYESQRATDVSPFNDWSAIRFWNREANTFGNPYAAKGFIYR